MNEIFHVSCFYTAVLVTGPQCLAMLTNKSLKTENSRGQGRPKHLAHDAFFFACRAKMHKLFVEAQIPV